MKFQYDLNVKKDGLGRNDPCPCGSGKKFKKCCIFKPFEPSKELLEDFELGQRLIEENGGHYPVKKSNFSSSKMLGLSLVAGAMGLQFPYLYKKGY